MYLIACASYIHRYIYIGVCGLLKRYSRVNSDLSMIVTMTLHFAFGQQKGRSVELWLLLPLHYHFSYLADRHAFRGCICVLFSFCSRLTILLNSFCFAFVLLLPIFTFLLFLTYPEYSSGRAIQRPSLFALSFFLPSKQRWWHHNFWAYTHNCQQRLFSFHSFHNKIRIVIVKLSVCWQSSHQWESYIPWSTLENDHLKQRIATINTSILFDPNYQKTKKIYIYYSKVPLIEF